MEIYGFGAECAAGMKRRERRHWEFDE